MRSVFMPKLTVGLLSRRLLVFALVLWLAGLGCFLGCEMSVSAATGVEQSAAAQADSCPAFKGHDCCHKVESKDGAATLRQTPTQMNCCPLAKQSADAARKVKILDVAPAEAAREIKVTPRAQKFTSQSARPLRVLDRGSTHLRHCVFLI
jgi:hypothetical protein